MKRGHHARLSSIRQYRALRLAAGGLFLMAMAWQHVQATRLGYDVERSRQRILALRCANGTLRMQLESTLSPANLSSQARSRMGMSLVEPEALRPLDAPALGAPPSGIVQRLISRTRRAFGGTLAT
jgi:hypothetical protein